jgi:MinD superfamily P-loop ATPase
VFEIVVLSGKGGTGKTTLTAAFAQLAQPAVICDLDVDAPDLHMLLKPEVLQTESFQSGYEAQIRPEDCTNCGICGEMCRFDAVIPGDDAPVIDPLHCEGCKVCVTFCPADAVDWRLRTCGEWYHSNTRFGRLVHAQLYPAQENSGRLVALLREQAKELARQKQISLILSDGPPGIGCPVISSLSGASFAVIVTEPTPSGRHDLARIVDLCAHFKVPVGVIVNKHDLSPARTAEIVADCEAKGLFLLGQVPFDPEVTDAMVVGQTLIEHGDGPLARQLRDIWHKIADHVKNAQAA